MELKDYKPLFPYFGGKRTVANLVWDALGDVPNYVEPFFGSGAVLWLRPHEPRIETVNDMDAMLANFWRAVKADPEAVARHADNPVNECDLTPRHLWLVGQRERITERIMGDPDWHDAKAAGWWCWGRCCWIGHGWCTGEGPWVSRDGVLTREPGAVAGVMYKMPNLGSRCGVNRQMPRAGGARGVNRKLPTGTDRLTWLTGEVRRYAERAREVRVCCGDWTRVLGYTPTTYLGLTGIFLDPPYADTAGRDANIYAHESLTVAHDVREWAIAHGDDPLMRIVLAGYEGEHEMPKSWRKVAWKAQGGYGNQSNNRGRENRHRERLWLSPHCLGAEAETERTLLAKEPA